jgi:cobalt transporter subunit CbtA
MFGRLLLGGLLGSLAGGIVVTAIQAVTATPLILAAERYEHLETAVASLVLVHDHAAPAAEGLTLDRLLLTGSATVAVATGYVLVLLAILWFRGGAIDARRMATWAVAGFLVTGLAPSLGLAPELPGSGAAELGARQLWWAATVAATAVGLAAIVFGRTLPWVLAGIGVLALPHVVGAPHPDVLVSEVPAELAAQFAATSLVIHALTWIVPAALAGYLLQFLLRPSGEMSRGPTAA